MAPVSNRSRSAEGISRWSARARIWATRASTTAVASGIAAPAVLWGQNVKPQAVTRLAVDLVALAPSSDQLKLQTLGDPARGMALDNPRVHGVQLQIPERQGQHSRHRLGPIAPRPEGLIAHHDPDARRLELRVNLAEPDHADRRAAPPHGERKSEERRVGKECRAWWSPYH